MPVQKDMELERLPRLVVGNHPLYEEVERSICEWKGTERALIVNSGYTANIGAISSLASRHDIVFSDKLNHASIVDGIILSGAEHKGIVIMIWII